VRIIFFGTPDFSVPSLTALQERHEVSLVVSQPDRPRNRGMTLSPPPVVKAARALGIEMIFQPKLIKDPGSLTRIIAIEADLLVTVAYGQLLPKALLHHPSIAAINLHASLLPRYRGAAPLQRVLMAGENETGVSIIHMVPRMDAGDIIASQAFPVDEAMDYGTLHDLTSKMGASLLLEVITAIENGVSMRIRQDEAIASYASRLQAEDCIISWSDSAQAIHNRIRALSPLPGAETQLRGKRLKVLRSRVVESLYEDLPGSLLENTSEGPCFVTGSDALLLLEVQPEGRKRVSAVSWFNGIRDSNLVLGR